MRNEHDPIQIPAEGFAQLEDVSMHEADPIELSMSPRKKFGKKTKWAVGTGLAGLTILGGGGYWAMEHPAESAELSRKIIGDEKTAWLESKYFAIKDNKDQWKYKLLGGEENPFDQDLPVIPISTVHLLDTSYEPIPPPEAEAGKIESYYEPYVFEYFVPKPKPMVPPETKLILSNPSENEGVWTVEGLPNTSADDVLMAKTYIRPDSSRPYASVGILLIDQRRMRLNLVGGTGDPRRDGFVIQGPGRINQEDLKNLLVAFNGGFQLAHGDAWGMYANGIEYQPMKKGYATTVVMKDGTIKMGTWGTGELVERTEDMEAIRQNCVLLVENGEVTPLANNQGSDNNIWGYVNVNAAEFITWRSAIGLTANGDFLIAAGNSLSANSLARAMEAAGAEVAMQLDINSPHTNVSLFQQTGEEKPSGSYFRNDMSASGNSPTRYLGSWQRDFMYVTLDETRFKPY